MLSQINTETATYYVRKEKRQKETDIYGRSKRYNLIVEDKKGRVEVFDVASNWIGARKVAKYLAAGEIGSDDAPAAVREFFYYKKGGFIS